MTKSADAFRTISEVADWLGVQPHVLRFWESKFTQVKPVKRAGGRRYYRPADMLLLGGIRKLLHDDGLTIKGVQKIMREEGMNYVADLSPSLEEELGPVAFEAPEPEAPKADPNQPDMFAPQDETPKPTPAPALTPEAPMVENVEPASASITELPSFLSQPLAPAAPEAPTSDVSDNMPAMEAEAEDETPAPQSPPLEELHAAEEPPIEAAPDPVDSAPAEASDALPAPDGLPDDAQDFVGETGPAPLPSFLKREPAQDATPSEASEPDLPAAPETESALPPVSEEQPAAVAPAEVAPEPAPEPAPVPRIVTAPDPDESALPTAPAALSAAIRTRHLTDAQRSAVLPLVARLAAHRDQLASSASQLGQA